MSNNSPTKKRKANDGRATVPDSSHSGGGGFLSSSWLGYFYGRRDDTTPTTYGENLTHKMDRMEKIMIRMEEKCSRLESECNSMNHKIDSLSNHHLSLVERRCENLEDKCSKLEHNMLGSLKNHVDSKFDKQNEYNNMLVKNQRWKYSTPVHSAEYWINNGYDEHEARYLAESSGALKDLTEKMRRGEFPDDHGNNEKGIDLDWADADPILEDDASDEMLLHWVEFTNALKQFTPAFGVLPNKYETFFTLQYVQLDGIVPELLKDALMDKPFRQLSFVNRTDVGDNDGMTIDSIMDIIESNKHLRKLTIGNNRIEQGNIAKICSAVCRGSIVEVDLRNCFENGIGDDMMTYLLINCGSKLKRLGLPCNEITSSSTTLLANFLATNPPLKELDLEGNRLNDNVVEALANALRSNTSLRRLDLSENTISDSGKESFRLVMHNDSSLNSIAGSNHSCTVDGVGCWTANRFWEDGAWREKSESFNRARKIYKLLSTRNKSTSTSNVQHFDDIDVKILPDLLKAVQRYANMVHSDDRYSPDYCRTKALSIVYEVMRKWDKVFPLYTDGR